MDASIVESTEVREAWPALSVLERIEALRLLPRSDAEDLFFGLTAKEQAELVMAFPQSDRRSWLRMLEPDDAADLLQACNRDRRDEFLHLLDERTLHEVKGLLRYSEDAAGGLMNPRFARLRPDMAADEALAYIHKQARERLEIFYYGYVCDDDNHLLGVLSFRELFTADSSHLISDLMHQDFVAGRDDMDQEALSHLFTRYEFIAMPILDAEGHMKGIVTFDDIVEVVKEEATEDIQKLGGSEALEEPYMTIGFWQMVKKRAGWLAALFLGEMLTATAMGHFENEIARAVVLALFVPLIISSGGNSGSQASTLVIRAMALGEVALRQWWRVMRREIASGLALGTVLAVIGFLRIVAWQWFFGTYGEHYLLVAMTVSFSLIGVVLFGTLAGSMLPLLLRRLGFDPASASAPFVATLVDVTGIIIYFSIATIYLL